MRMTRLKRTTVLVAMLALVAMIVPDAGVATTRAELVKFQHAEGVALEDDMIWILAVGSDARPARTCCAPGVTPSSSWA